MLYWFLVDDTSDFLHRSVSWSLIHVLAILIHNVDTFYLTLRFGKNGICITILIRFSYSFLYQLSLPAYLSGLIILTYYFSLLIHYSYTFHLSPSYTSYHKCCHFFCLMFILFHLHDYLLIHLDYTILFFFVLSSI